MKRCPLKEVTLPPGAPWLTLLVCRSWCLPPLSPLPLPLSRPSKMHAASKI